MRALESFMTHYLTATAVKRMREAGMNDTMISLVVSDVRVASLVTERARQENESLRNHADVPHFDTSSSDSTIIALLPDTTRVRLCTPKA